MSNEWRGKAACAGMDSDYWFPTDTNVSPSVKRALEVCRGCEVRLACLAHAIDNNEHHGIWGGMTARRRQEIRRRPVLFPREAS
jgi:WhiB family transcriptional regulator, redox-sensing transcriptional regulator